MNGLIIRIYLNLNQNKFDQDLHMIKFKFKLKIHTYRIKLELRKLKYYVKYKSEKKITVFARVSGMLQRNSFDSMALRRKKKSMEVYSNAQSF